MPQSPSLTNIQSSSLPSWLQGWAELSKYRNASKSCFISGHTISWQCCQGLLQHSKIYFEHVVGNSHGCLISMAVKLKELRWYPRLNGITRFGVTHYINSCNFIYKIQQYRSPIQKLNQGYSAGINIFWSNIVGQGCETILAIFWKNSTVE